LAIQVLDAVFPFFLVEMKDNLGVGLGGELVSLSEEIFSQFEVVKDLAIEGDPERGILVAHRLVAASEINNTEPGVRQTNAVLQMESYIVRAAVRKHPHHPVEGFPSDRRPIQI
jgi:hypothetical protein